MQRTLTLPNGHKLRTATQRRYVAVKVVTGDDESTNAYVLKRSDNLGKLYPFRHGPVRRDLPGNASYSTSTVLMDTETGEVVA